MTETNHRFAKRRTLNCNGRLICLDRPLIMGIVNVTPDSFYAGAGCHTETELVERCGKILDEGADIIDLGAVSTRPGAEAVTAEEEWSRLATALATIGKHFPDALLSVDTYGADIARRAVKDYGVHMINDISAGKFDEEMFETVAELNVPYILMHIRGTPKTMQDNPEYDDLMSEMIRFFSERIHRLHSLGVKDIVIDPGFGFGKTMAHNYEILRRLSDLEIFELPVLAGMSRKSMICKLLGTDPEHALNGTTAVNMLALMNGADILRVHDVKEAAECIKIAEAYKNAGAVDSKK